LEFLSPIPNLLDIQQMVLCANFHIDRYKLNQKIYSLLLSDGVYSLHSFYIICAAVNESFAAVTDAVSTLLEFCSVNSS